MVEDIRQQQYHRHRDQRLSQPGRNLLILKAWQPQQANDQPKDQDKVANSSNPLMQPMVIARTRGAHTAHAAMFRPSAFTPRESLISASFPCFIEFFFFVSFLIICLSLFYTPFPLSHFFFLLLLYHFFFFF